MNFSVIIPAYAQDVLDSGATGYGFLMAASGVGSLLAALWLAFGDGAQVRRIAYGAIMLGAGEVALGFSQVYSLSLLLMVVVGFGAILMAATANTTIQLAVPDYLRGRVMSVYTTIFAGSTPIGGPLMGGIASFFGVAVSLAIGGVLSAAVGIGAFAWIRRHGLDRKPLRLSNGLVRRRREPAWRRRRCLTVRPRVAAGREVRQLPRSVSGLIRHGRIRPVGAPTGDHADAGSSPALAAIRLSPVASGYLDGPEDERRVEPAEPERGRQHPSVRPSRPSRSRPGSSAATSGSGSNRLTEAGAQPSRMVSAQIAASMAPDAPSGWP